MTISRSILIVTLLLALTGCRSELFDQAYGEPLERSEFFEDDRISRSLVEGTVARGELREDDLMYTGRVSADDAAFADQFPMQVTREVVERGQERYNIYCSPCHGYTGHGNGMIVQRGMKQPPSYHIERLQASPAGYFYDVMTNGFGVMYSYASRVKPADRWAIVAYIRALQRAYGPEMTAGPQGAESAATASGTQQTDNSTDASAEAAGASNDNQTDAE